MSTITPPRQRPQRAAAPERSQGKISLTSTIDPIRVLRRHFVGIIAAAAIGAALGVGAYYGLMKFYPLYSGQVLFEVRPGLQTASQIGTIDASSDDMVFRIAQTETYMLVSREVLSAALRNPDITKTKWYQKFTKTQSNGQPFFDQEEALDDLIDDVGTSVVRSSNLFSVSWSSHEPKDVPIILNAIETAYSNARNKRDSGVYDKNLELFTTQLSSTQHELEDLAAQIKLLVRNAGFTSLEDVNRSTQAYKVQELTSKLAEATGDLNIAQSSYQLVSDQLAGKIEPSAADVLEAEHDQSLMGQISDLQSFKAELRRVYGIRIPGDQTINSWENRVKATEAEVEAKKREIIHRNLDARLKLYSDAMEKAKNSVESLEKEIEKNQDILKDYAAEQSQYEALKVRREHLESQRTADMQLINEVKLMRLRADASRVTTAQPALTPREPSFPKPQVIIPLCALILVGLTVGLVFLRELMDQRVKTASDLAVLPGANVLAAIPDIDDDPTKTTAAELVVRKHPFSVLAESYRQASTTILPLMDVNAHQSLVLVGGLPGSGTTTVATNLAAAAAASGRRVLAIDANFRRPRLAQAMGLPSEGPGFADLLSGAATIDQATLDAGNGITVIPAGTPANRVFDRLNNGMFDSVMAELRGRYDLIIFDAPPAVVSGDALVLANKVDAAVLVVRAHQEHRGLVARMINRLAASRSELLGVVLNRPRGIAGGYLKKNYATMAEYSVNTTAA